MTSAFHPDWLRPDWPAPAHIHALCTTRAGGVSAAPFDSLNLGDHVGDAPAAVRANRQRLQAALHATTPGAQPVFLQQIHGTEVLDLCAAHGTAHTESPPPCADASATTATHLACTIMVADCLPVLLTNRQGSVVAAAHAGWRGLAGAGETPENTAANTAEIGVVESVFKRFMALDQQKRALVAIDSIANSADLLVWLGPCIGQQAFEVGAEVRAVFCQHDSAAAAHFVPCGAGKYLADLAGLARQRLLALGIGAAQIYGNDSSANWCTVSNPSRFFSHRRDNAALGGSGRLAVCIWRS
ncbi:MAG: laccase domain-containing protein [Giesbergeria sp.]|nr:laccase domain-containing protein [Giesbergeria sp.]